MFVDLPLRAEALPGPAIGEGYTITTSLMLPRSRGSVRLAGAEPDAPPLIDPNYYADPRDLEIFTTGLRATREIGRAAALDQWRPSCSSSTQERDAATCSTTATTAITDS